MENVERGATQVASGAGKTLWVLGDLYEFKATGEETGGLLSGKRLPLRVTPDRRRTSTTTRTRSSISLKGSWNLWWKAAPAW